MSGMTLVDVSESDCQKDVYGYDQFDEQMYFPEEDTKKLSRSHRSIAIASVSWASDNCVHLSLTFYDYCFRGWYSCRLMAF